MAIKVAALFVEAGGVYSNLAGVDPWDIKRDARLYAGPYPVVAHPPCARWSRLAGFCEARHGLKVGRVSVGWGARTPRVLQGLGSL